MKLLSEAREHKLCSLEKTKAASRPFDGDGVNKALQACDFVLDIVEDGSQSGALIRVQRRRLVSLMDGSEYLGEEVELDADALGYFAHASLAADLSHSNASALHQFGQLWDYCNDTNNLHDVDAGQLARVGGRGQAVGIN